VQGFEQGPIQRSREILPQAKGVPCIVASLQRKSLPRSVGAFPIL
jgi:hypothetical protein